MPGTWRRRLPHAAAVALTVAADVAVAGLVMIVLVGSFDSFARSMPVYLQRLQVMAAEPLDQLAREGYPVSAQELAGMLSARAGFDVFRDAAARLTRGFSFFVLGLLTLVFALIEASTLPAKLQLAFGRTSQVNVRLRGAVDDVQTYLRVKTLISLAVGFLFGLWLFLLGVEAPVLWGFLAFVRRDLRRPPPPTRRPSREGAIERRAAPSPDPR